MSKGTYLYDDVTGKVLPKDEVLALRAQRKPVKAVNATIYENKPVERGHWIYDRKTGEAVPSHLYRRDPKSGLTIQKDIEPYQAVFGKKVDGKLQRTVVGSRAQHRDELRARGVEEVGNEKITKHYEPAPGVSEDIRRAMHETGYHRSY